RMPARSLRSDSVTLAAALPMHDTTPMPVTTTRREPPPAALMAAISESFGRGEQSDPQVGSGIDLAAIDQRAAIGDDQLQLAAHDPADVDLVADQLRVGQHLAGELHLAHAQRAAAPGGAQPGQVEPAQLPHRIHAEAAGHHRVALEVAVEEPEVRTDVELGPDHALAVLATLG